MMNVILPTYNEAKSIVTLIYMLKDVFSRLKLDYKIIIVDDNSPDGTSDIIKKLNYSEIEIIDRPKKEGLGSSYLEGFKKCTYKYTLIMDSDLQHDPEHIIEMWKKMEKEYDIVTGTRYSGNGKVCGWPFSRCFISCTANNLARYILGLKTTDLTGSFRLYKTEVFKNLIPSIICKGFGFQMEIIARAELKNYKIAEEPIIFHDRSYGKSKMVASEIIIFMLTIAELYFKI